MTLLTPEQWKEAKKEPRHYSQKIKVGGKDFHFFTKRKLLDFTEAEKTFCKEAMTAFEVMFNSFEGPGLGAHFRTALMTSLMDISVARNLRGPKKRVFWAMQRLIQASKHLSFQRYEGSPATTGFLVYGTDMVSFRRKVKRKGHEWQELEKYVSVDVEFFQNPLTYRFVNGVNNLYACNFNGRVKAIIGMNTAEYMDVFQRHSYRMPFDLLGCAAEGAFAVFVNDKSEIEILTQDVTVLFWRRGSWFVFDPAVYRQFLEDFLNEDYIPDVIWAVYTMSKMRKGAVILINKGKSLKGLKATSIRDDEEGFGEAVFKSVRGKDVSRLKKTGELLGILSSDGLTVISGAGKLTDTGVIVKTDLMEHGGRGGARAAAARAASKYGPVIMVSEDGPIELHLDGRPIYRTG